MLVCLDKAFRLGRMLTRLETIRVIRLNSNISTRGAGSARVRRSHNPTAPRPFRLILTRSLSPKTTPECTSKQPGLIVSLAFHLLAKSTRNKTPQRLLPISSKPVVTTPVCRKRFTTLYKNRIWTVPRRSVIRIQRHQRKGTKCLRSFV